MNTASNVSALPILLTPSPRVMRREGRTQEKAVDSKGKEYMRQLNPGETSLDWSPKTLPLFSFPWQSPHNLLPVAAGSAIAIVREGYEAHPLGIATDMYRPVQHQATAADVAASTQARCEFDGALIDGHGFHTVHGWKLHTDVSETVRDLPLVSKLTLVHDHTGSGSLRASVVSYLGDKIVVGSRNFTRRIHVGNGDRDVGVGSRERWTSVVIDAMLETANLQQAVLAAILRKADETPMTDEHAKVFEAHGVAIERSRVSEADKQRGEKPMIVAPTALDVVIDHHKQRKGRLSWGVWSRRLEGGAIVALETITGIALPAQLFKRH